MTGLDLMSEFHVKKQPDESEKVPLQPEAYEPAATPALT